MRIQLFTVLAALFALLAIGGCDGDGLEAEDQALDEAEALELDDEALELDDEALLQEDVAPDLTMPPATSERPKEEKQKCRTKCNTRYKGCMADVESKTCLNMPQSCDEVARLACKNQKSRCLDGCDFF